MKRRISPPQVLTRASRAVGKRRDVAAKAVGKRLSPIAKAKKALNVQLVRFGQSIERVSPPWLKKVARILWWPFGRMVRRIRRFLRRRPHRSFRPTSRYDYKRSLALPGFWSFTNSVRARLWRDKKLFGGLIAAYFFVALIIGGLGQQEAYQNLSNALNETGSEVFTGNFGTVAEAGLLLTTSVVTGLTPNATEAQGVLGVLAAFFAWLATVWALRARMADRVVKVRDAIYTSGAPVLSTLLVGFITIIQLLPLAIAFLVYTAAIQSGFIAGGVELMLAWVVLVLLIVLSLYWMTATLIALVVVTLPGMYPFQAIRTAGDIVVGRRIRILLRLLWLALLIILAWLFIVIPVILGDAWLKQAFPAVVWLPLVPLTILLMSSITIVFAAAYIYMLYRKVVDDDAAPA